MTKVPAELIADASARNEFERGGLAELWRWPRIIDALVEAVTSERDCNSKMADSRTGTVSDARR